MSDQIFSLAKDQVFSLGKLEAGETSFYIGLDWDPSEKGADVDLDAVLIAVDESGSVIAGKHANSFLFYGNDLRDSNPPSPYYITEDNRSGDDSINSSIIDDEAIFVNTALIDSVFEQGQVAELRIFVVYHDAKGKTLQDVSRIGLRIAPLKSDNTPNLSSQVTFDVADVGQVEGAHMASLIRNPVSGWEVKAVGEAAGNLSEVAVSCGLAVS